MKSVLCRKGYILTKSLFDSVIIDNIKNELTVAPKLQDSYNKDIEPFPVFIENSTKISIPKYYGLHKLGIPDLIVDDEDIDIDLKFSGVMRPHQKKVLDTIIPKLMETKGGLISLPCGFGKTDMALYIISDIIKKKTLIIVHKTFLMNQWKERILKYYPEAKVGVIIQDKIDVDDKDIVIGMLQSISMKSYDIGVFQDFGLTVIDECLEGNQEIPVEINKKIEIIKIKDLYNIWIKYKNIKIIAYDYYGEFKYCLIDYMWERKKKEPLYIFKIKNMILKCTGKHKIYTPNGFEFAKDLQVGKLAGYLYNKNIIFEKIIDINIEEFEGLVYDISVPELHNFVTGYMYDKKVEGIIVHNCHHIPSRVFSRALTKINSKYMIGLSATPYRKDKLEKIINWFIGPMLIRIEKRTTITAKVKIYYYKANNKLFKPVIGKDGKEISAIMMNNIVRVMERNEFIINLFSEILEESSTRQIMFLSDRKDHLEYIKKQIEINENLKKYTTGYYIGGMTKTKLKESESKNIIFGTYAMASEGLDIPTLDTIIMGTPRVNIEQTIGRIVRKDNVDDYINQPLVIDIADMVGSFQHYAYARKRIYKKMNYEVEEYNVDNIVITNRNNKKIIKKEESKLEEINYDSD
jgi:superfamily II DNA or RNA helicase